MKPAYSKLLPLPVILALVMSLGMDRGTRQGYRILRGIAIRAYDGDAVAMRRLVNATKSSDQNLSGRARWQLSVSLNPYNAPALAELFERTDDETVRTTIKASLSLLRTKRLGRVVLRAVMEQPGEIGALAEELLAKPYEEAPTDEQIRLSLLQETPQAWAYRDSLFVKFERADTLPERMEVLKELYRLGDERLVPYIDDLLAAMEAAPVGSRFRNWKFVISTIIERVSLKKGSELPVSERQEIYNRILSALVEEESSLLDLSGQPVKLQYPRIGYQAKTDRVIYVKNVNLKGIQKLELEGYRTPALSIWEIKSVANKRKWVLYHLDLSRVYGYLDYAVLGVSYLPTSCIRHPGPWLSGSGSQILLRKKDGEWRFRSVLSSFVI